MNLVLFIWTVGDAASGLLLTAVAVAFLVASLLDWWDRRKRK